MIRANELKVGQHIKIKSTITGNVMNGRVYDIGNMTPGGITIYLDLDGQMVVTEGTAYLWEFELIKED